MAHVLLGTGYDVNITRYNFLSPELVAGVSRLKGYRDLGRIQHQSPDYISSVLRPPEASGRYCISLLGPSLPLKELTTYISRHKAGAK